jgi:hypothetical protein
VKKLSDVGVPQGSVLFIIFINHMCYLNLKSKLFLFADEFSIYFKVILYKMFIQSGILLNIIFLKLKKWPRTLGQSIL